MRGPDYYAAAQDALAQATRSAELGYTAKSDQELRFAEANMAMARLALDAALAAASGNLTEGIDLLSDDGGEPEALAANASAWIAAVTEGGA